MKVLNWLFIFINLFNYIDRGFISSLDTTFVDQYNISDTTSGFINSSFIIGYLIFSPIFSLLVKRYNKIILIFIGLSIWSGFNMLNAFFNNIYLFIIFRSFVGVGEASYGTIVPPLIDRLSDNKYRSLMLSLYFLAMPLGFALGFIISGFLRQYIEWHYLFLIEGVAVMILNVFLLFFVQKLEKFEKPKIFEELTNPLTDDIDDSIDGYNSIDVKIDDMSVKEKVLKVLMNKMFMIYLLGYTSYNFLIGTFSFWGPGYMEEFYNYSAIDASYIFGGFTVVSGVLGSFFGGLLLDFLKNKYVMGNDNEKKRIKLKIGNIIILTCLIIGYICCSIIFLFKNIDLFFGLFGLGEICLFGLVGPINSMLIWSMENKRYTNKLNDEIKVIGCAISICMIHLLGDVPSPILTGYILDNTHNWNWTFFYITQILLIGITAWTVTMFIK